LRILGSLSWQAVVFDPRTMRIRKGIDLQIQLRDVVAWRAKDADKSVVRALMAGRYTPTRARLLQDGADA